MYTHTHKNIFSVPFFCDSNYGLIMTVKAKHVFISYDYTCKIIFDEAQYVCMFIIIIIMPLSPLEILYETITIIIKIHIHLWPGMCSRFRVLLLAGRSGVQTTVGENFFCPSRPVPIPTQPPVRWVLVLIPGNKAAEAWR